MTRSRLTIIIVGIFVLASGAVLAQGNGGNGNGGGSEATCSQALMDRFELLPSEPLSGSETNALVHMREEEKLARDVCATLALKWDIPVFVNIARAEQRHMELVALLLTRYELQDPVVDDAIGAFTDPAMTQLFQNLVAAGEISLVDALAVGATIEDLDLADLYSLIYDTNNQDIALIAYNLAKGSRNHMRAFTRALELNGGAPYQAQYLSQDQVDEIVASERELRVVYDELGDELAACDGQGRGGRGRGGRGGRGESGGQGGGLRDGSCLAGTSK